MTGCAQINKSDTQSVVSDGAKNGRAKAREHFFVPEKPLKQQLKNIRLAEKHLAR